MADLVPDCRASGRRGHARSARCQLALREDLASPWDAEGDVTVAGPVRAQTLQRDRHRAVDGPADRGCGLSRCVEAAENGDQPLARTLSEQAARGRGPAD